MLNIVASNLTHLLNKDKLGINLQVDNFVLAHGKEPITSLIVLRKPINQMTIKALEVVSPNFKRKNDFSDLFHGYFIINNKYIIDKRETLYASRGNRRPSGSEVMNVSLNKPLTIYDLLNNTKKHMGVEKMREYSAKNNNCEDFMIYVLTANGLLNSELKDFIKQQTDKLFTDDLRKTTNTITDVARNVLPVVHTLLPITNPSYTNPLTQVVSYLNQ